MSTPPFHRVLVANRGEIAIRIFRTLRRLGIESVAVYSEPEADAPHVAHADQAVCIGKGPVAESYLLGSRILAAALTTGAEAVHPGYGLLSENAAFARACVDAGLVFVGPPPAAIEAMGDKVSARRLMSEAGVPVVPGALEPLDDLDGAKKSAAAIGYPVAVKASGAGGGKGFRVAATEDELEAAIVGARGEGERFFGNGTVYLERYLEDPRHVEVQVLADAHGATIHLYERDCSIQRRHQKLVEEAPAPAIGADLRARIGEIAVRAAQAVSYTSAGTVEGLLTGDDFYFLEMNTRIQVEHGVTELVTGVDLVEQQLRVAAGERLSLRQEDVVLRGHAIECRINAEDATRAFRPSPGTIGAYVEPVGEHVRVDSGVLEGSSVLPYYDPMIAKVLVWGPDRRTATDRMRSALDGFRIDGIQTLLPFHRALLATDEWEAGGTCRELTGDPAWLTGVGEHAR